MSSLQDEELRRAIIRQRLINLRNGWSRAWRNKGRVM